MSYFHISYTASPEGPAIFLDVSVTHFTWLRGYEDWSVNSTGAWVSKTPAIFDTREIRQAKNGRWHKKNKFDRQKMEYGTIFFQFDRGVGVESGVVLQ